jgi:type 1 glutamine amidotransferase
MASVPVNAYLICGGRYHDMDYARLELLKLLAEHERVRVRVAEDYRDGEAIAQADFLVTYTCDVIPDAAHEAFLNGFLSRGGRWLALHGTNSVLKYVKGRGWDAPRANLKFMQMLGSQFLAHPPIKPYRVDVSDASHPLVAGIEPFDADDELYLSEYHGANHALLHTRFTGEAPGFTAQHWPGGRSESGPDLGISDRQLVLYLHAHQGGEILYCTLGHCRGKYDMRPLIPEYPAVERGSWKLPVYHEILRRGIRWAGRLTGEEH